MAAHLSHLILNWNDDTFIFRQRINCNGRRNNSLDAEIWHKPPCPLPAHIARNIRYFRLIATLFLLFWECFKCEICEHCKICPDHVSYATHICGAAAGLITGYIFLRARRTRKIEKTLKIGLFTITCGLVIGYIFLGKSTDLQVLSNCQCTWIDYQTRCHSHCYRFNVPNNISSSCSNAFSLAC
jgi:hypothetical protein